MGGFRSGLRAPATIPYGVGKEEGLLVRWICGNRALCEENTKPGTDEA